MGEGTCRNTQRRLFAQLYFLGSFASVLVDFLFALWFPMKMQWCGHKPGHSRILICAKNQKAEEHDWVGKCGEQSESVCDRREKPPDHRVCRKNPATDRTCGLPKPTSLCFKVV